MKKLFAVTCEILIDAEDRESAMEHAREIIADSPDIWFNFMVHDAEIDDSFPTLGDLRKYQAVEQRLQATIADTSVHPKVLE